MDGKIAKLNLDVAQRQYNQSVKSYVECPTLFPPEPVLVEIAKECARVVIEGEPQNLAEDRQSELIGIRIRVLEGKRKGNITIVRPDMLTILDDKDASLIKNDRNPEISL
ncbi:hypothetical protein AM501_05260 [Aneurinibacillus migulanus]|uniref:hypothetical protein n=1 Tax=Aneurinibacillus migulanus TaxID=47500 RepID=UPI0005B9CF01|nr:hypothetical protein [Aneurinibacillus migulanus]KIV58583.1 hypothetical protein TS64_04355 [Aneurinibacillus migulanus]KPD09245.1 hypothetical protein AM501_05260 [Aneurinibacillus migulanus]